MTDNRWHRPGWHGVEIPPPPAYKFDPCPECGRKRYTQQNSPMGRKCGKCVRKGKKVRKTDVKKQAQASIKIAGYREVSEGSIELVNVNKRLEEKVLRQLDLLSKFTDLDQRWLSIARTHIEQGFMAANRSIMQPERLDGDL